MSDVIGSISEVTPQWLTLLLRDAGYLNDGDVTTVRLQTIEAFNSVVVKLEPTYSAGAVAPHALILKLNADAAGQEEVAFYDLVKIGKTKHNRDDSMLVSCVEAAFDAASGASQLLLIDVSGTHEGAVERESLLGLNGVPSKARLLGVVEALARFHATWWEHPFLSQYQATRLAEGHRGKEAFERRWEGHQQDYSAFASTHGKSFPAEIHALYKFALDAHRVVWTKYLEPRVSQLSNLTLTHNDAYLTQFLSPKSDVGPTYLVDFQSVCTDFAARDLVYLLSTFWTCEQRQRHESALLTRYHQVLTEQGVTGYSLTMLFEDYRLALIDMIFHPLWDTTYGAESAYWRPKLECLVAAYQDWNCEALLQG